MTAVKWQQFLQGLPESSAIRPAILQSWRRSAKAVTDPSAAQVRFVRVPDDDLAQRLATAQALISASRPHLERLSESCAGVPHVAYVTDRDGIVMDSLGDAALQSAFGLTPGYDWSEKTMGTNGAGTALAAGQPVAVIGDEHFIDAFHDCTCTGAPIRDSTGTIVGAIDVSTSVADARPERLSLVTYVARMIERDLRYADDTQRFRAMAGELRVKQTQQEALVSRLELLCDNVPTLIYLVDSNHRFLNVNKQWEALVGRPCDEVIGRSLYDIFPKEAADAFAANNRMVLKEGRCELEEVYGDRTYLSLKVAVPDEHGNNYAICGFSTDITARKQFENELTQSRAALEAEDTRKDLFLAMLSHELRNPLAPILDSARYLSQRYAADQDIQNTASLITRSGDRLKRLVNELLDVARARHGRIELQLHALDLRSVVTEAAKDVTGTLDMRRQPLRIRVPSARVLVRGDDGRLIQVITNLLHNASKFSGQSTWIDVELRTSDGAAVIDVRDRGIGMTEETLAHVFEPFWQEDKPGNRGGLGLGLYLTRTLVEAQGGSISAASDGLEKGSCFTVRLPLLSD